MDEGVVVVCKAGDVSDDLSVNVLWVVVVFQVFMISVDSDRVLSTNE